MKKNYTNSDIFNSYIQIAEKKGLVSLAAEDESVESAKKALEKNPRADSLTKERISKLYNVKPDTLKNMQYDRNIIERAHPKPVIIAPSYDKLNGLVENNNERQDIMLRIVNKRTNGLLTQHKYAREEMVRALVRVANDMDNRNEEELRSLADECLEGFTKEADEKKDFLQEAWSGIKEFVGFRDNTGRTPYMLRLPEGSIKADMILAPLGALIGAFLPIPGGTAMGFRIGMTSGLLGGSLLALLEGTGTAVRKVGFNAKDTVEKCNNILNTKRLNVVNKNLVEELLQEIGNYSDTDPNGFWSLNKDYENSIKGIKKANKELGNKSTAEEVVEKINSSEIKPSAEYNKKLSKIYEKCSKVLSAHEEIKKDFDEEEFGSEGIKEKVVKVRDFFADLVQNVGFGEGLETYSYARFIDSVGALQQSIIEFKKANSAIVDELKSQASSAVDALGSEEEPSDTEVGEFSVKASHARRLVNFIKNS